MACRQVVSNLFISLVPLVMFEVTMSGSAPKAEPFDSSLGADGRFSESLTIHRSIS